jgi:hypothetical protein
MPRVSKRRDPAHSSLFEDLREAVEAGVAAAERASTGPLCRVGMVLRALLAGLGALGIALLFHNGQPLGWLFAMGAWSAWVVPSTLAWLVLACACSHWLRALPRALLSAVQVGLGALLSDRKSTRLNSSHNSESRMPSSA